MSATAEECPCGTGRDYEECCGRYLGGEAWPETAEALMRARYTAYARANVDFIEKSTHPKARGEFDRAGTLQWAAGSDWTGLEILEVEGGGTDAEQGSVDFVAHYRRKGETIHHQEVAEFARDHGRWHFVDGRPPAVEQFIRDAPKVGRNEPCPCGSGKKYKRCCGA